MAGSQFANGLSRLKKAGGHDTPTLAAPAAAEAADKPRAESRAGLVQIAAHFDPAVRKQLMKLGLDQDRDNRDLIGEALNDLFVKYGLSDIVPVHGQGSRNRARGK